MSLLSDKEKEYGKATVNMSRLAELWTWYLNHTFGIAIKLKGSNCAAMEALHKASREVGRHKDDNLVDKIGYTQIEQECIAEETDTIEYEIYCDESYYHMWAVRPVNDHNFESSCLHHFKTKAEAESWLKVIKEGVK